MKSHKRNLGLVICIFLAAFEFSFAQEKGENEITIGYGYYSHYYFITDSGPKILFGISNPERTKTTGCIYANYIYTLSGEWFIGVNIVYEEISEIYTAILGQINDQYDYRMKYITTAFEGGFKYIRKPSFQLYSSIGVGLSLVSESTTGANEINDKYGTFNYHINFVGARIGKTVALKIEFGFGYKGLVNGGLAVRI